MTSNDPDHNSRIKRIVLLCTQFFFLLFVATLFFTLSSSPQPRLNQISDATTDGIAYLGERTDHLCPLHFCRFGEFLQPRPTKGRCWFSTLVALALQPLQFCLHFCGWQPPMRQVEPIKQSGKHLTHNLSARLAQQLSHGIHRQHVDKRRRGEVRERQERADSQSERQGQKHKMPEMPRNSERSRDILSFKREK